MNTSPIKSRPGQVIGLRPARRHEKPGLYPIYAIAGGSAPAGEPAAAPPAPPAAPAAPAAPPAAPAAPAATPTLPADWDGKIEDLPKKVQDIIREAREDAGKARTTAKEQAAEEARNELLAKLGLNGDGTEKVDPAKLAEQLASKDAQLLQLQREGAATKAARLPAVNADIDALLDSRSFVTKLNDLDPASKSFDDDVKALVEAAVKENPKLKLQAQAAGVSGGQFAGGTGEQGKRPTSIGAAIAARNAS